MNKETRRFIFWMYLAALNLLTLYIVVANGSFNWQGITAFVLASIMLAFSAIGIQKTLK